MESSFSASASSHPVNRSWSVSPIKSIPTSTPTLTRPQTLKSCLKYNKTGARQKDDLCVKWTASEQDNEDSSDEDDDKDKWNEDEDEDVEKIFKNWHWDDTILPDETQLKSMFALALVDAIRAVHILQSCLHV